MFNQQPDVTVNNFWSHHPDGMTVRDMLHMGPEERRLKSAVPAGAVALHGTDAETVVYLNPPLQPASEQLPVVYAEQQQASVA